MHNPITYIRKVSLLAATILSFQGFSHAQSVADANNPIVEMLDSLVSLNISQKLGTAPAFATQELKWQSAWSPSAVQSAGGCSCASDNEQLHANAPTCDRSISRPVTDRIPTN